MKPMDLITSRRVHLARFSNRSGAEGERTAALIQSDWTERPRGAALAALLAALKRDGVVLKASSFDALATPSPLDFTDQDRLRSQLALTTFIEIKTANQTRVKPGFAGFFFALTEAEIQAADQLGDRHRVALFNKLTDELLLTSVAEILSRSRSTNWQVSVQL